VTQVDFYILDSDSDDARLHLACKIVDKATQLDHHVFIHSTSDDEARQLDELLWTFSQGSFIPHRIVRGDAAAAEPAVEPVLIGVNQPPAPGRWDVLINLASDVPEFFSRYERVAEVVDANAARREQSRERYRFYRDRGYKLNTHQV
jgi:DNA polymerase-3 subunit chi